jgi:hypothetical protein
MEAGEEGKPVGEDGLFWHAKAHGEQKLLELADGLLTTTGCGRPPRKTQQV